MINALRMKIYCAKPELKAEKNEHTIMYKKNIAMTDYLTTCILYPA